MILWLRNNWRQALLSLFALSVLIVLLLQHDELRRATPFIDPLVEHSGKWAIRFLLFSLLMTPLNTYFSWRWAIPLRKTAGLWAFGFGMLHFVIYFVTYLLEDVDLLLFFTEIFIIPAVIGLIILSLMAATSNRWSMKRLGKNWKRLHRLVYIASLAVVIHSILAASTSKKGFLDPMFVNELKIYLGVLIVLLGLRLPPVRKVLLSLKRPRVRAALTSIILCLFVNVTLAKVDPYVEDPDTEWGDLSTPMEVWSPTGAVGLFGRLDPYGDVDAFAYTFDEPYAYWRFEIIVPTCGQHFKDVFPAVALIGPGLKAPEEGMLPFALPQDTGAEVFTTGGNRNSDRRITGQNSIGLDNAYASSIFGAHIPQAGTYTLVVWEPQGNVGAYALASGDQHDQFAPRSESEREADWDLLLSGEWMRQDCNAPLALESCPATVSHGQYEAFDVPLRAKVGEGFVLSGEVRDSSTCLPIKGAKITYWLTNEQGEYDDEHEGAVLTNAQGLYRIETNIPGQYENVEPHIHFTVSAAGYQPIISEYLLRDGPPDQGIVPIALKPE